MSEASDRAARLQVYPGGELPAFDDAYREYGERTLHLLYRFTSDEDAARDLLQDVFVKVYENMGSFEHRSQISTWIYRIAVQKSLEHIRAGNRKKRSGILLSLFGREHLVPIAVTSPFYHPGIKLENKERAAILFGAIRNLAENQRTAFTLHKVESMSYAEIAEIMKVSVSSVESLMFRAKQNLQKQLSALYDKNEI